MFTIIDYDSFSTILIDDELINQPFLHGDFSTSLGVTTLPGATSLPFLLRNKGRLSLHFGDQNCGVEAALQEAASHPLFSMKNLGLSSQDMDICVYIYMYKQKSICTSAHTSK